MKSKLLHEGTEKTFAVIFEKGDEVASGLLDFAKAHSLRGSHFTAIGAFERVTLGFFERERKDYKKIEFNEQTEVLSLIGDIALKENGEPQVHAHVVVASVDEAADAMKILDEPAQEGRP